MLAKNSVVEDALALYQWNAEASAAFLYAIHVLEICVRNAAANAAQSAYGANWPSQQNFASACRIPRSRISARGAN